MFNYMFICMWNQINNKKKSQIVINQFFQCKSLSTDLQNIGSPILHPHNRSSMIFY